MNNMRFTWTSGGYQGGCTGDAAKKISAGWYVTGTALPGVNPIVTTFRNPSTGLAYTTQELIKIIEANGPPSTELDPIADVIISPKQEIPWLAIGVALVIVLGAIAFFMLK